MATMLGSLLVSLGLESGEFKSGLDAAERQMKKTTDKFRRMGKDFQRLGSTLTKSLTLPIAALGTAFGVAAGRMAKESKSMANSARLAGSGFEDFQRQAYAARVGVGIEFEKLGDIFKDTQDKIGDFLSTGGGEMADFFENIAPKVGLTAEAFRGLSGREGLQLFYNALEQAGVSSDQMVFYMESIADEASGLIPLLKENGQAFKELGANASIISSDDAKQLEQYTQAQLRMEQATRQLTIAFVNSGLLDSIVSIARSVADLAEKLSKASPQAFQMAAGALAMIAALGPLISLYGGLVKVMAPAIASFVTFKGTVLAAAAASGSAVPIIAGLRAAVVSLTISIAPWVAAIAAAAAILYLLTKRSNEVTDAQKKLAQQQAITKKVTDSLTDATDQLAYAHGEARKAALEAARAEYENTKQTRDAVWWKLEMAKAELRLARIRTRTQRTSTTGGVAGTAGFIQGAGDVKVAGAQDLVNGLTEELEGINKALSDAQRKISAPAPVSASGVPSPSSGSSRAGSSSQSTARDPVEIENQFNSELASIYQATWSAMSAVATSAEERAELELRSVELARLRTLKEIEANEDYSEAQKKMLTDSVEFLADRERAAIEFQKVAELEREAADMLATQTDLQRDKLDLELSMADTQADRARISAEILALEQAYRRNQLEMVIASATAADAEKARAQAILDSLDAIEAGERAADARRNESDTDRWLRNANKTSAQMAEAVDGVVLDGLDAISDRLSQNILKVESLGDAFKVLRDTVQSVVQDMLSALIRLGIQKAIASAIGGGGVPGFATGTSFAPGGLAIVGEQGPELVNLPRGSKVYTNGVSKNMLGKGAGETHSPHFHFPGITNAREAREAGSQAALRYRRAMQGPVR